VQSSVTRLWTWYNGACCRVWPDFGPGTTVRAVECDPTLDPVQRSVLSSVTRLWTRYNGACCRVWPDFGPGTTERAVECDSTLDPVQRSVLWSVTRLWTRYNGACCEVWLDFGPGTTERAVECDSTLDLVQRSVLSSVTRRGAYNGCAFRLEHGRSASCFVLFEIFRVWNKGAWSGRVMWHACVKGRWIQGLCGKPRKETAWKASVWLEVDIHMDLKEV